MKKPDFNKLAAKLRELGAKACPVVRKEKEIPDDCCSKTGENKGHNCCHGPQCKP